MIPATLKLLLKPWVLEAVGCSFTSAVSRVMALAKFELSTPSLSPQLFTSSCSSRAGGGAVSHEGIRHSHDCSWPCPGDAVMLQK